MSAEGTLRLMMFLQPWASAALGLWIVAYILQRLFCCASQYSSTEKMAMSLIAAGMVMATPALWLRDTPFDGWSFNVARLGIAIFIVRGGLRRTRHHIAHLQQEAYGQGFLEGRRAAAAPEK